MSLVPVHDQNDAPIEYHCFTVTASNGTFTAVVEGSFSNTSVTGKYCYNNFILYYACRELIVNYFCYIASLPFKMMGSLLILEHTLIPSLNSRGRYLE